MRASSAAAAGSGRTASNDASASSASIAEQHAREAAARDRGHRRPAPPPRPARRAPSPRPRPAAETSAVRRRWRCSARSACLDAGAGGGGRAVGGQLRGARERVDQLRREARPRRGLAAGAGSGRRAGRRAGRTTPAIRSAAARTSAAAGRATAAMPTASVPASRATAIGPAARSHRFWSSSTSATNRDSRSPARDPRQAARDERLEAGEQSRAHAAERPQGCVVPGQAFEIAQTARETPNERTADDRDRQCEDRRLLGRLRDQLAGRRHQADAGGDRQCPEHRGRRERAACGRESAATRITAGRVALALTRAPPGALRPAPARPPAGRCGRRRAPREPCRA